jgi:hypothetical protein
VRESRPRPQPARRLSTLPLFFLPNPSLLRSLFLSTHTARFRPRGEDIYDSNMKLCKVMWTGYTPGKLDNYGEQSGACGIIENYWDVQNDHVSYVTTYHDPSGNCVAWDSAIPAPIPKCPEICNTRGTKRDNAIGRIQDYP